MIKTEIILPVRYYETDQMGVVHHSNYIRYFECARNALMAEGGFPISVCEEEGVVIPVVSVDCKFHHPAKMGDILRVTAVIGKTPLAKLVIEQEVWNQDEQLCAKGQVVVGFLDKHSGRPVRCPERLVRLIENNTK